MFLGPRSRIHQAGQAVLEYLLVLFITVAIILGILYQFNDAFKNFLDTYFGDYIACLLETGELPALGGSGPNQGTCVSPFIDFSLNSGSSLESGGSSGSGGGSQGSQATNSESSDPGAGSGSSGGANLRPSQVSSTGAPSNAEQKTGGGSLRPNRQAVRGSDQTQGGRETGLGASSGDSAAGGSGRRIVRRRVMYYGEDYLSDQEKKSRDRPAVVTNAKARKKAGDSLRKSRFDLELPEARGPATETEDRGFDFATLLKFLLIAGILIAIIIFIGGQAMQIKKSWQKSE